MLKIKYTWSWRMAKMWQINIYSLDMVLLLKTKQTCRTYVCQALDVSSFKTTEFLRISISSCSLDARLWIYDMKRHSFHLASVNEAWLNQSIKTGSNTGPGNYFRGIRLDGNVSWIRNTYIIYFSFISMDINIEYFPCTLYNHVWEIWNQFQFHIGPALITFNLNK